MAISNPVSEPGKSQLLLIFRGSGGRFETGLGGGGAFLGAMPTVLITS